MLCLCDWAAKVAKAQYSQQGLGGVRHQQWLGHRHPQQGCKLLMSFYHIYRIIYFSIAIFTEKFWL
jgi:hypothetical protein